MGRRTSPAQEPSDRDQPVDSGPGPQPCHEPQTPPGTTLNIGPIFAQTVHHFFPDLPQWIDQIDDPRFAPFVEYDKHFLVWWGLCLFLLKLGSRRQLDYQLNTLDSPALLDNLNRLAGTKQKTRPVNKTLNYFLRRTGSKSIAGLRTQFVRRLIRMKALDGARLQGHFVTAMDGTGYLLFRYRHCEHCLTQQHGKKVLYMHQALEVKLLGPADTVISIGTEFIDNRDAQDTPVGASAEQLKQDCELKAGKRMAGKLREEFPQLRLCLSGDSLFGCGEGLQIAKEARAAFVYVFKAGRIPTLWQEFQELLKLSPEQKVETWSPADSKGRQVHRVYRWVTDMSYEDSQGRKWAFTAIECRETDKKGEEHVWAWVTDLKVDRQSVVEVSTKGGRHRWHLENQGFNVQKNSGLNLEHAYSHTEQWPAYYYLLQIAHTLLQLVEKGNLLRQLAQALDKKTALHLYGSLKNMAQRLAESLRLRWWPEEAFDRERAASIQIRLDSG